MKMGYYGSRQRLSEVVLPLFLFILTVLTTVTAGTFYEGFNPFEDPRNLIRGIPFSLSLLFILGSHELGHYFAGKKHRVLSTLPFFIPGPPIPPLIGTFGAVIKMKSPITTKKALVDIGSSGPLIGFIAAIIVTVVGLNLSTVSPVEKGTALGLGTSLIFEFLSYLIFGQIPAGSELYIHPVAFSGWLGFFVTSINLLPIGQLDGGHIVYALFDRLHSRISIYMVISLVVLGIFTNWWGWFIWSALVVVFGIWHPPVADANIALDWKRKFVSIISLAVFVLTFVPLPFYIKNLP